MYRLSVKVEDTTGVIAFVIFNKEAENILHIPVTQLRASFERVITYIKQHIISFYISKTNQKITIIGIRQLQKTHINQ